MAFGGGEDDMAYAVRQTSDGGYIAGGGQWSFGAGEKDWMILKLNADGSLQWRKIIGGPDIDNIQSILQTEDGGYMVAGYTLSFGQGEYDMLVAKLSADGAVKWSKTYGGPKIEYAKSIKSTPDGGYVVAGTTGSFGSGAHDVWILKIAEDGSIDWQKTYGGANVENTYSISVTQDGGYFIAGQTNTLDNAGVNIWVMRLDSGGNVIWDGVYGGSKSDGTHSAATTSDGGFIVAGDTNSYGAGGHDFWVIKLSGAGTVEWAKAYGGSGDEYPYAVIQAEDGGFVISGETTSFGAGAKDAWVIKLGADGAILWQWAFGGAGDDLAHGYSIEQTSDNGYVLAAQTASFGAGASDIWILKLFEDGSIPSMGAQTSASAVDTDIAGSPGGITVVDTFAEPYDVSLTGTEGEVVSTRQAPE